MAEHPNVLIVGAGIIGASIAWHLCRGGARVTVIESGTPGGIATRRSWAWINASRGNPEPYFRLRMRAMAEWRRLEQELPELRVSWSGGLIWDMAPAELDAYAAEHGAWGYGIRHVDRAEITRIEPALAEPPDRRCMWPRRDRSSRWRRQRRCLERRRRWVPPSSPIARFVASISAPVVSLAS